MLWTAGWEATGCFIEGKCFRPGPAQALLWVWFCSLFGTVLSAPLSCLPVWRRRQIWSSSPSHGSSVIAWGCCPCNEQQPSSGKWIAAWLLETRLGLSLCDSSLIKGGNPKDELHNVLWRCRGDFCLWF